jgi:hypothetical protein
MTDYPSIKPEDVREGDVVEVVHQLTVGWQLARTLPHLTDDCYVAGEPVPVTQLRLVSRPTPPEPPLRVGDWVRDLSGSEGQITVITDYPDHSPYCVNGQWREGHNLTRIEPPVGWPVGVPTIDAPTVWYFKYTSSGKYVWCGDCGIDFSWADLLAAGGVPALAVTR